MTYTGFINAAINIARAENFFDPSPGKLVAWRTAGSGSPGKSFLKHVTLAGIDFYYIA